LQKNRESLALKVISLQHLAYEELPTALQQIEGNSAILLISALKDKNGTALAFSGSHLSFVAAWHGGGRFWWQSGLSFSSRTQGRGACHTDSCWQISR
jgi:hypothetical protein